MGGAFWAKETITGTEMTGNTAYSFILQIFIEYLLCTSYSTSHARGTIDLSIQIMMSPQAVSYVRVRVTSEYALLCPALIIC